MTDHINPAYYKQGDIEAIEAIEAMLTDSPNDSFVDYCRAQIVHYLWRMGRKDAARQDAAKSRWYINRLVDYLDTNEPANPNPRSATSSSIYPGSRSELDEREDRDAPKPCPPAPAAPEGLPLCKNPAPSNRCGSVVGAGACDCGGG